MEVNGSQVHVCVGSEDLRTYSNRMRWNLHMQGLLTSSNSCDCRSYR